MLPRGASGRHRARRDPVRWALTGYVAAAVALTSLRRRAGVPRPATVVVATSLPFVVGAVLPRGRVQYTGVWVTYMWLFKVAWEAPYDRPEKLRRRLHVDYAPRIDRAIGGGAVPSARLQHALRDPPRLTAVDYVMTFAYHGLWLAPHAVLGWLMLTDERRAPALAGCLAGVYQLTTVGYWLLPTAPPWWAAERGGRMDGDVQRVAREVRHTVARRLRLPQLAGRTKSGEGWMEAANPWGSMPSDAVPAAAITARWLTTINPAAGAVAWTATGLLAFALVYLGEHYVLDVIVGLAVAETGWRAKPALLPLARLGMRSVRALERLSR